jgi:hypothetical protein
MGYMEEKYRWDIMSHNPREQPKAWDMEEMMANSGNVCPCP